MAPKRAHDQLGCALSVPFTSPPRSLMLPAVTLGFSFLASGNWPQTRKQHCKLGFLAGEAMVSDWFFSLKSHLLLQWNSCEPFNWGSVCQRVWKSHSSSLLAQFHKTAYWNYKEVLFLFPTTFFFHVKASGAQSCRFNFVLSFFMPLNSIKANPIRCNFPGSGMDFDLLERIGHCEPGNVDPNLSFAIISTMQRKLHARPV